MAKRGTRRKLDTHISYMNREDQYLTSANSQTAIAAAQDSIIFTPKKNTMHNNNRSSINQEKLLNILQAINNRTQHSINRNLPHINSSKEAMLGTHLTRTKNSNQLIGDHTFYKLRNSREYNENKDSNVIISGNYLLKDLQMSAS